MIVHLDIITIKRLLAENSLTASALSTRSGISRQSVSTILGRGTCSVTNAGKLARALGVDVDTIWKEG